MVLGGLFGCCGVASLGGQVMNRAVNPLMEQMTANAPQNEELRRFTERNAALQARIFPLALTSGLLALLHSLALVVGGIMAYSGRASGRSVLVAVCAAGVAVELINGGLGLYLTRETNAMTAEMMKATFANQPDAQGAEQTPEEKQAQELGQKFASGAARAGSIVGIAMVVTFFALKTAFYVATVLYLRRKDVVDFFETPRAAASA
jgi:hypothetical protein